MSPEAAQAAARMFAKARAERRRIDTLPEPVAPATLEDGYAVQDAYAALSGEEVAGWKIGCTSREAQELLGVHEPVAGRVFASVLHESPATLDGAGFVDRVLETEFVFRLGADLPPEGGPYDRDAVADAVASVHPGIEIVDPRFTDWLSVGAANIAADNCVNGALVVGPGLADWRGLDLAAARAAIELDGECRAEGTGAAVLGHPLEPLVWLANHLVRRGDALRAGQYVTTGTCAGVVDAAPGQSARVAFDGVGEAAVTFTA